jgi:hypothetical protein
MSEAWNQDDASGKKNVRVNSQDFWIAHLLQPVLDAGWCPLARQRRSTAIVIKLIQV